LYLNPAGAAAMKDMENAAAVVNGVAGMESAIKMLPDSIDVRFFFRASLCIRKKRERKNRMRSCLRQTGAKCTLAD
jgi:hypothetical protein